MPTFYLTFGQAHAHHVAGRTFDKDVLVRIVAEDMAAARAQAFAAFHSKWACLYEEERLPELLPQFPRGVFDLERA